MPIKEIINFGIGIMTALFIANGTLHFRESIRRIQFQILKELGRTDNWGNPSIFKKK